MSQFTAYTSPMCSWSSWQYCDVWCTNTYVNFFGSLNDALWDNGLFYVRNKLFISASRISNADLSVVKFSLNARFLKTIFCFSCWYEASLWWYQYTCTVKYGFRCIGKPFLDNLFSLLPESFQRKVMMNCQKFDLIELLYWSFVKVWKKSYFGILLLFANFSKTVL